MDSVYYKRFTIDKKKHMELSATAEQFRWRIDTYLVTKRIFFCDKKELITSARYDKELSISKIIKVYEEDTEEIVEELKQGGL